MIGRSAAYVAAAAFSGCVLAGVGALIIADLFGEDALAKLWDSATTKPTRPEATSSMLENARDITFFTAVPAKEYGIEVMTGVAFETVADLLAARQKQRWCYVQINPKGGITRNITLGKQSGTAAPAYSNLSVYPAEELAVTGLSARTLQSMAKTHCRFAKTAAHPSSPNHEGRT